MPIQRFSRGVAATLLAMLIAAAVVAAHSATQSSRASSPDELVGEVRALRADVQESAAATIRAQLLVGRLQLQEGRINNVAWQLADVRRLLEGREAQKAKPLGSRKSIEERMAAGVTGFDQAIRDVNSELARIEAEEQPLRNQETQLASQLKAEQQRWMEFSSRLDELERALPNTPRKQ